MNESHSLPPFSQTLKQPLINTESEFMSEVARKRNNAESISNKQIDFLKGRIYASNAPRIMLETITARTALLIIALTYIFFIIGFALDFATTYKGFHGSNKLIGANSCASQNLDISDQQTYWGCSQGKFWNSTVTHLQNVLSVKLNVQQYNMTLYVPEMNSTFKMTYNVNLWACYEKNGCGENFATDNLYSNDASLWQQVLTLSNQEIEIDTHTDFVNNQDGYGINVQLVSNTFQNQESIPTNGLVKAYRIEVQYLDNPYDLFSAPDAITAANTQYFFNVLSRPKDVALNALTVVLLMLTLCVLGLYSYVLYHQKKLLSEQKWVVAYFILLILFQNPDYCVIIWYKTPPTVVAAYSSYVIGYLAQSGLFILWLLFADSIQRKTSSKAFFYLPKVFIGLVIFTVGIVILTFQFPGLDPTGSNHRNAVEAVTNWSGGLKHEFVAFSILYIVLIWTWTVMWFARLVITGRRLNKLPYMSTRYIQLSYRFFFLQATLVTLYYLFQYVAVVYFISSGNTSTSEYNPTSLTDNINTLFRQQTQLFGKTLFLTVYAIIIAFLFLPANLSDSTGLVASLAATYVITETEHKSLVRTRLQGITSMKNNLLNKVTRMDQIMNAKADVFCVDIALNLRNIAFQSYYDPEGLSTVSGYDGSMDLDKIGFVMVDRYYDKEHEVFCFIAREKRSQRLVVSFRGTASKRQMEDNLNFKQMHIDFKSLSTETLDQMDGLSIKQEELDQYDDDDLDSCDEDDLDAEEDTQHQEDIERGSDKSASNRDSTGAGGNNEDVPRETLLGVAGQMGQGVQRLVAGAVDVTNAGINTMFNISSGVVVTAAQNTPGLKSIVKPSVHSGFWGAYSHVRDFVHAILRKELVKTPTTVFFTGHSLGGALATYAALDVSIHTVPRVNAYLKHKERQAYGNRVTKAPTILDRVLNIAHLPTAQSTRPPVTTHQQHSPMQSPTTSEDYSMQSGQSGQSVFSNSRSASKRLSTTAKPQFIKKIKILMYNFGSPRVGNGPFAVLYDKEVPKSYRVVVDGDVVTALPPSGYQLGYQHIGTEILIDSTGSGSIIIDPSFVERWLRTHTKSSVAAHSLLVYRKGLLGIKLSAEFMKQRAVDYAKNDMDADPLRLALKLRGSIHADMMSEEYDTYAAALEEEPAAAGPRSAADQANVDELRLSMGLPKQRQSSLLELRVSPSASPTTAPTVSPMAKQVSQLTPNETMIIQQDSNAPIHVGATDKEDALHYAHDVETMETMLTQIQGLKKTGPIKWLKQNTYGRVVRGKGSLKSKRSSSQGDGAAPSGPDPEQSDDTHFEHDDEGVHGATTAEATGKVSLMEGKPKSSMKRSGRSKEFEPVKSSSDGEESSS